MGRVILLCLNSRQENNEKILGTFLDSFYEKDDIVMVLSILDTNLIDVPAVFVSDGMMASVDGLQAKLEQERKNQINLLCLAKEYLVSNGVKDSSIETILKEAGQDVSSLICDFAKNSKVDLICTGCHRRNFIDRTLFGSVSSDVIHHSRVPAILFRI